MLNDSENADIQTDGVDTVASGASVDGAACDSLDMPTSENKPESGEDTALPVSQNSDKEVR